MEMVFLICAVAGGTVVLFQFVMMLIGMDGDGDVDLDGDFDAEMGTDMGDSHGSSSFFGILSFRTIVTAFAFFGVGGMGATKSGANPIVAIVIALAAGYGAMLGVYYLMRGLHQLREDGTLRMRRAMGKQGTVYIPIPANQGGVGKVQLRVDNRIVEIKAVTNDSDVLATGKPIVVTDIIDAQTVCVEPLKENAT